VLSNLGTAEVLCNLSMVHEGQHNPYLDLGGTPCVLSCIMSGMSDVRGRQQRRWPVAFTWPPLLGTAPRLQVRRNTALRVRAVCVWDTETAEGNGNDRLKGMIWLRAAAKEYR